MQYLFTERAHLMCPHMCFGIVMTVKRIFDEDAIRSTIRDIVAAHPFLNALMGYEKENAYYYSITDQPKVQFIPMETEIANVNSQEIMNEYVKLTDHEWNLYEEGMLKIRAWKMTEETCFLLVFHHLLADGRGALGLAQELADCYVSGIAPTPATEKLISSISEFPKDSKMSFISRFLIKRANRTAEKEYQLSSSKNVAKETTNNSNKNTGSKKNPHPVSYEEYLSFAGTFMPGDKVNYNCVTVDSQELSTIREECHTHNVTINDYLLARMMRDEKTSAMNVKRLVLSHIDVGG